MRARDNILCSSGPRSAALGRLILRDCTTMTNGHGIETPANKIAAAQATLGLAIRLSGEVEAGRITTEI